MPGAFDYFGKFETSLRSYRKDGRPLPECPHGVHSPEECGCDHNHECKRPHCANDIPLDPLCKLSQSTPFGVPISIWSYHKCHSGGCGPLENSTTNSVAGSQVISSEVAERLYSTPTRSSSAKLKTPISNSSNYQGTTNDDEDASLFSDDSAARSLGDNTASTASPSSSLDCKDGPPRLVAHLVTAHPPGNHNSTRKDGISPASSRRSLSARGRRNLSNPRAAEILSSSGNPCKRSQSSCAAPSIKFKASQFRRSSGRNSNSGGDRLTESSDVATSSEPPSSPDPSSPDQTPLITPRKTVSPKNSWGGASYIPQHCPSRPVGSTPRAAVLRPSAVFAGGRFKPAPLNKSASDGVERLRSSMRRARCSSSGSSGASAAALAAVRRRELNSRTSSLSGSRSRGGPPPVSAAASAIIRSRLSRVSSESRVDELLTQAHMVLETFTPEQDASLRSPISPPAHRETVSRSNNKNSASTSSPKFVRKLSGEIYKDLESMLLQKTPLIDHDSVSNLIYFAQYLSRFYVSEIIFLLIVASVAFRPTAS